MILTHDDRRRLAVVIGIIGRIRAGKRWASLAVMHWPLVRLAVVLRAILWLAVLTGLAIMMLTAITSVWAGTVHSGFSSIERERARWLRRVHHRDVRWPPRRAGRREYGAIGPRGNHRQGDQRMSVLFLEHRPLWRLVMRHPVQQRADHRVCRWDAVAQGDVQRHWPGAQFGFGFQCGTTQRTSRRPS